MAWRVPLILGQQPVEVILPLFQHLPKILLKKHNRRYSDRTMSAEEERVQADAAADNQLFSLQPLSKIPAHQLAALIRSVRATPFSVSLQTNCYRHFLMDPFCKWWGEEFWRNKSHSYAACSRWDCCATMRGRLPYCCPSEPAVVAPKGIN